MFYDVFACFEVVVLSCKMSLCEMIMNVSTHKLFSSFRDPCSFQIVCFV